MGLIEIALIILLILFLVGGAAVAEFLFWLAVIVLIALVLKIMHRRGVF